MAISDYIYLSDIAIFCRFEIHNSKWHVEKSLCITLAFSIICHVVDNTRM